MTPASPLTVVQMLPDLDSGGVERGTLEIGAYLVRCGHRSIVVSGGGRLVTQLRREGSRHITLPVGAKSPRCLPAIFKVRRLLLKERPHILHLRSRLPAWVGLLAVKSIPAPLRPHVVTTFHGFYSINGYSAVMAKGERVIAISTAVSDHIQRYYGVPLSRIEVIHRGFDEAQFHPGLVGAERVARLEARWDLRNAPRPVILLPGRITRLKGSDIFLRSLARLRHLPWTAVCVGEIENKTSYYRSLLKSAERFGIRDRIRFPGHCTDMPAAFRISDIAVSATSSRAEAFGRIAVEAQAMGIPVVATAHGGSLETVLPEKTGWLVAPGDPVAMARALSEAITQPEVRRQFGNNGMQRVWRHFTAVRMYEKTLRLYRSVAALDQTDVPNAAAAATGFRRTKIETRRMTGVPLTVVQMLPELDSGGVERGTLEMGAYLAYRGHRSIVVSGGGRLVAQLRQEGSRHVTLPVGEKNPRCLLSILAVRRLLLRERVDILHLRSRLPAWVGLLAVRSLPVPLRPHVVTTFHGFYSINGYSAVMARGERVIAISEAVFDHIQKYYGVPRERIDIIPRGIDEALFHPDRVEAGRIAGLRIRWGIGDTSGTVIMLPGRITEWKGHDLFIESLSRIRHLAWTALCVGDADEKKAYYRRLVTRISRLGLEGRIRFVGHCADMPAALMVSDVAISASSSQAEAFGRVAIEAQAMGIPVVATAHGGSLETVLPGKTGWLVPPRDPEAMALALSEAIANPEKRRRFGENAMAWVHRRFTARRMCEETLALYEAVRQQQPQGQESGTGV